MKKQQTQQSGAEVKTSRPFFSVVVSNWNGSEWLLRCLSALQLSARKTKLKYEIIVVDDASDDDSVAIVRESFKSVRLLTNPKNIGFGASTNRGIHAAKGRVIVLCNNDLVVKEEFLPALIDWFAKKENALGISRKKLFGVAAKTLSWWDGKPNQLRMNAQFIGGRMTSVWHDPAEAQECLYLQAGAAAYDAKKLKALGCFRSFFEPGYWEDYDLSYRAAKQGLINVYEPKALALHHGGGSMSKRYGNMGVTLMKVRNHLIFEWLNLSSPSLLIKHSIWIPYIVLKEWLKGSDRKYTRSLWLALRYIPKILRARIAEPPAKRSDLELLKMGKGGQSSF